MSDNQQSTPNDVENKRRKRRERLDSILNQIEKLSPGEKFTLLDTVKESIEKEKQSLESKLGYINAGLGRKPNQSN
jgi:hypothetical protein